MLLPSLTPKPLSVNAWLPRGGPHRAVGMDEGGARPGESSTGALRTGGGHTEHRELPHPRPIQLRAPYALWPAQLGSSFVKEKESHLS